MAVIVIRLVRGIELIYYRCEVGKEDIAQKDTVEIQEKIYCDKSRG